MIVDGVTVIHGKAEDIVPTLDIKFDAIITDIPYGTTDCKWDKVIPFNIMWDFINHVRKETAAVALFGSEPFSSALRMNNIREYRYDWIWNKKCSSNMFLAKIQPLKTTENISIFYKKRCTYYPIMTNAKKENIRPINFSTSKGGGIFTSLKRREYIASDKTKRYPTDIISISSRLKECNSLNILHPTQKPVELMEYLIRTYTKEGDTVLDFCAGSGTTGEACLNLNRKCYLIEKEQKYIDIIINRLKDYQPYLFVPEEPKEKIYD